MIIKITNYLLSNKHRIIISILFTLLLSMPFILMLNMLDLVYPIYIFKFTYSIIIFTVLYNFKYKGDYIPPKKTLMFFIGLSSVLLTYILKESGLNIYLILDIFSAIGLAGTHLDMAGPLHNNKISNFNPNSTSNTVSLKNGDEGNRGQMVKRPRQGAATSSTPNQVTGASAGRSSTSSQGRETNPTPSSSNGEGFFPRKRKNISPVNSLLSRPHVGQLPTPSRHAAESANDGPFSWPARLYKAPMPSANPVASSSSADYKAITSESLSYKTETSGHLSYKPERSGDQTESRANPVSSLNVTIHLPTSLRPQPPFGGLFGDTRPNVMAIRVSMPGSQADLAEFILQDCPYRGPRPAPAGYPEPKQKGKLTDTACTDVMDSSVISRLNEQWGMEVNFSSVSYGHDDIIKDSHKNRLILWSDDNIPHITLPLVSRMHIVDEYTKLYNKVSIANAEGGLTANEHADAKNRLEDLIVLYNETMFDEQLTELKTIAKPFPLIVSGQKNTNLVPFIRGNSNKESARIVVDVIDSQMDESDSQVLEPKMLSPYVQMWLHDFIYYHNPELFKQVFGSEGPPRYDYVYLNEEFLEYLSNIV